MSDITSTEMGRDISDNLSSDGDLLDILRASTSSEEKSELEHAMSEDDEAEADKKMQELKDIAARLDTQAVELNTGSGDLNVDLSNWFNGTDKVPSSELSAYMSNASVKMDYGLTRQTLSNFDIMGKLRGFIENSFDMLFDDAAVMSLTPEELEERVKMAFTMYKELANLNQRTVMSIKDYKMKYGSDNDDIDKISLLLSSIPSDKLKSLLSEINSK